MKKIYLIGTALVAILLYTQVSMGFVPLFILLILFLFFPLFERRKGNPDQGNRDNSKRGVTYMLMVMLFGLISLISFKNYVHPREEIYKNIDHHALRVDGILIGDNNEFSVAGNRDDAFFDEAFHNGRLYIQSASDDSVTIKSEGFTEPVYMGVKDTLHKFHLVGDSAFVSFEENDKVEFVKKTPQGEIINSLVIRSGHENSSWKEIRKHVRDTASYIFNGNVESIEHRFLKSGLALSDLMSGIAPNFDPTGIFIFRDRINSNISVKDIHKFYNGRKYYIGYTSDAEFSQIRVNGVVKPRIKDYSADIKFGEPFYIGFGNKRTETMCFGKHDGKITLEYYLPKYQYLSTSSDNQDHSIMVTTSVFDGDDGEDFGAYTENIALFNQFDRPGNKNQMQPWYLSYRTGKTDVPINLTVYSDKTYLNCTTLDETAKENKEQWALFNSHKNIDSSRYSGYFHGIHTTGNSSEWLVGVENFKNTTPFSASKMAMVILAVIILSAISIRVSTMTTVSSEKELLTGAEYAAYLIVIGFMTIRCFLFWRVTTFPPISSISYYEFNHLRDSKVLDILLLSIILFYGIVLIYKIYLLSCKKRFRHTTPAEGWVEKSKRKKNKWMMFLIIPVIYAPILLLPSSGSAARFTNILLPVLLFFIFEYVTFNIYGKTYHDDLRASQSFNPIDDRRYPVIVSLWNIIWAFFTTFIKDGGYGVMFLLFGLIISIFLISDLWYYTNDRKSSRSISLARLILCLFVVAFGLLYVHFFIWILDYRQPFSIGLFFALCIIIFLLAYTFEFTKKLNKWWKWLLFVLGILSVSFLVSCGTKYAAENQMDGTHLEYRTRVHMASPVDIIANVIDDDVSQNKFMQASIHDFVLQEYFNIGKNVHPFTHKTEYFKIQPQSKLGAMWFAQTTDIALSRFIIAEHSIWLAILLVGAIFIFLLVGSRETCNHRSSRIIQLGIPLLLFLQAGLILFANTRLFIFFGQDFPLISITSKLSSVYFFVLFTLFLISVLRERDYIVGGIKGEKMSHIERAQLRKQDCPTSKKVFFVGALIILLLPVSTSYFIHRIRLNDTMRDSIDGVYSLENLMESLKDVKDSLNVAFTQYQNGHTIGRIKKDMSEEMAKFKNDDTYKCFLESMANDELAHKSTKFGVRVIENYINKGSHHNSAQGLVHLRTERTYDKNGNYHDTLKFEFKDNFYEYKLPMKNDFSWKGSIIGVGQIQDTIIIRSKFEDVSVVKLKKEWLRDHSKDLALVHTSGSTLRVMGENSVIDVSKRGVPTVAISGRDNVFKGKKPVPVPVVSHEKYFARNVVINGYRTFLYPYGLKLFWIREFANQIKYSKESIFHRCNKLATKEEKEHFNDNVPISISSDLSKKIYSIYAGLNSSLDRTVVVADGDGHIKGMIDYRGEPDFRLNPNDERKISGIIDMIYLNGLRRSTTEQRYFSTFATSPLRLGPGSSQKPITWTAVTSGYNIGFWESLSIKMKQVPIGTKYIYSKFAGQDIQKDFKSPGGDEGSWGSRPTDLEWYMYKSSNYYNAMMAYFGLFTKDQLQSFVPEMIPPDSNMHYMVKRAPSNGNDEDLFPIMSAEWGKGYERFSFANTLNHTDFSNRSSLLAHGLEQNFGLPLERDYSESLYPGIKLYRINKEEEIKIRPSYRQVSYFNMGIRDGHTRENEMMEIGVRTVAIGNNTSWIVSPVKMTEMFGRLIMLNKNYSLSLEPDASNEYQLFDFDNTWAPLGHEAYRAFQTERKNFIYGLSNVFNIGTAKGIINNNFKQLNICFDNKDGKLGEYYIYGKTGTINAKWSGVEQEHHMLAVVITDKRISATEDLSKVKFYVLYFADFGIEEWKSIDSRILEAVIKSDDFKKYMSRKNS